MDQEIKKSYDILVQGGLILYPTDTVWGIGCDATNSKAVAKIYALKNREETKSMICLVNNIKMLKQYVESIPQSAIELIQQAEKPTTIIYNNPKNLAKNLISNDNTLGVRIANNSFCNSLIDAFGKPIVSTSANISGQSTPQSFEKISEQILKGVDYIVNSHRKKKTSKPSSIIKLGTDGKVIIIRE